MKKALEQAIRGSNEASDSVKRNNRKKMGPAALSKSNKEGNEFDWEERFPWTELNSQSGSRDRKRLARVLMDLSQLKRLNVKAMKQQRCVRSRKLVKTVRVDCCVTIPAIGLIENVFFFQVSAYMHEHLGSRDRVQELGPCRRPVFKQSIKRKKTKHEKQARFSILNIPSLNS